MLVRVQLTGSAAVRPFASIHLVALLSVVKDLV
jgi:hypothetical protein